MPKLKEFIDTNRTQYLFWCLGCKTVHPYTTNNSNGPSWTFNGDMEKPTFMPSLKVLDGHGGSKCHLFVVEGKINYCSDCQHNMAGQQDIPMIEWDDSMW